ncbi:hypothetical protein AgCh_039155 [Apium graveolens]
MARLQQTQRKHVGSVPRLPVDVVAVIAAESGAGLFTEDSRIQNIKLYPYKELQIATSYFNAANKLGEGGFGSVYKGKLKDGTLVAIKVLSAESRQGVREFLTEVVTTSDIEHENLVGIYGCCVEGVHI